MAAFCISSKSGEWETGGCTGIGGSLAHCVGRKKKMDYHVIRNAWGTDAGEVYGTPLDELSVKKNKDKFRGSFSIPGRI